MERSGDLPAARSLLNQEANTPAGAEQLARFLDRHGDMARRDAYVKWASEETDVSRKRAALREVVLLDVIDAHRGTLKEDLQRYQAAGGTDLQWPSQNAQRSQWSTIQIPGPLSSFARMAALSPELPAEDLLPSLARNIVTNGFEAAGNEALQQTEYLRLLVRYIGQARELQALAGGAQKIVIPSCDSQQTGALLKVLGYRMRGSCGSDLVLETVNPTRAFLTVDSSFPLTQLEEDLRANHPFELPYAPTAIPVLYDGKYWIAAAGVANADFLDAFTSEPSLCRLYLGLSHVNREVAGVLRKQMPSEKLRLYANVLDFYGGMWRLRDGAVVVPGPAKSWAGMVGAPPSNPGPFFEKLLTTDDGWLASYFDALLRIEGSPAYGYLTQPERLKRFYDALRGRITSPGPARPVFRSSTDLMLFTNSLQTDANGNVHVPGGIDVWRGLFLKHPHGKYDAKLTRAAANWRGNDDLLEALFALSRKTADNEPLHIFLAVNDIDRARSHPLSASFVARLISAYHDYSAQFTIFAENPALSEASMNVYLDLCADLKNTHDVSARADRAGSAQALVGLWSILCRQNAIPVAAQDATFAKLMHPFLDADSEVDVFSASRKGVDTLLAAAQDAGGETRQDKLVYLLAGPVRSGEESTPESPATNFLRMFDAQLLMPVDELFDAADHLGKGELNPRTVRTFHDRQERLDEFTTLHSSISRDERNLIGSGFYTERHIDSERKFTLDSAGKNSERKDVRAALMPFLRDSLVGLLYCYYAPAGSQIMLTNPAFVRMHDFAGSENSLAFWHATEVTSAGWPANAGGKLTGSLVTLPYALAQAEQNFLIPRKEQALIWADMVPQLVINVTVTRWRSITPEQLRWVALHLRRGRSLLAAASLDPSVQAAVVQFLSHLLSSADVQRMQDDLNSNSPERAATELPTSYLYALALDPTLAAVSPDGSSAEIAALAATGAPSLSPGAIARAFGTPKPTLTHSFTPGLLYLRTFPTLMGYSSRLLAESWESHNLYYAALADEAGIRADQLDAYVPEWNRTAIENIFATHLEDWPALIRSLNSMADAVEHRNLRQASLTVAGN